MKTIFLSYKREDEQIAGDLKQLLSAHGYYVMRDEEKSAGSDWRTDMMHALKKADIMIPIYTEKTFASLFVPGEVGMARAYKDMGKDIQIIPLLIQVALPQFLSDLNAVFISAASTDELGKAAKQINDMVQKKLAQQKTYPCIFISHRHKDEKIAEALINLLEAAFEISHNDLRCTSVHPYKLSPGAKTSERLKDELNNAAIVLGMISPGVDESQYVLFELGAAWGLDKPAFPLLISKAAPSDVPGPLGERHCISLFVQEDCWQLIEEIKQLSSLTAKNDNIKISTAINKLVSISG